MPKRPETYESDPAYSALQKETGLRIAAIRKIAELTQEDMSEMLRVPQSTWSKWERGKRMADIFVMTRFAARLKISTDLIYRGLPVNSHPTVVATLQSDYPELLAEQPQRKEPDKDKALASYRESISRD